MACAVHLKLIGNFISGRNADGVYDGFLMGLLIGYITGVVRINLGGRL